MKKRVENAEYGDISFGRLDLTNESDLSLRFTNDKWDGSQETDRNVIVDYVKLVPVEAQLEEPLEELLSEAAELDERQPRVMERPTLLRDYHMLRSFSGDMVKRYGTVEYSPYNDDGWDKLEF